MNVEKFLKRKEKKGKKQNEKGKWTKEKVSIWNNKELGDSLRTNRPSRKIIKLDFTTLIFMTC